MQDFVCLSSILKEYNKEYKGKYPQLTKTEVITLCQRLKVPLYSFKKEVRIRARIYVHKSVNICELLKEEFQETQVEVIAKN